MARSWRTRCAVLGLASVGAMHAAVTLLAWPPNAARNRPFELARGGGVVDRGLDEVSRALATVAARVKPSVVYITSKEIVPLDVLADADSLQPLLPGAPPLPAPLFRDLPRQPGRPGHRVPRAEMVSSGSGVLVSPDGYILTNEHVVAGARQVTVRLLDRREFRARVIGTDPTTDVAVLKIDAHGLTPLPIANSDSVQVGELVLAVGNPLGESLTFSVTSGIVGAKGRVLDLPNETAQSIQDFIQTDAPINEGNSGGPLVNTHGEMVGINAAIASPTGAYAGYGFAVPSNLARRVMQQIVTRGHVVRVVLGVTVHDASAEDAAYVGLPQIRGVLVEDFGSSDSPARTAGLQPGDVIIAVDGKPVDYVAQLQEAIAFRTPGDVVSLTVARKGGARATVRVPLQRAPADTASADSTDAAGNDDTRDRDDRRGALMSPLGIRVVPSDDGVARMLRLPPDVHGVVVLNVSPWGPAADRLAGIDDGGPDVILSVEGTPVRTPAALRDALRAAPPGSVLTLHVYNVPSRARRVERVRTSAATGE